MNKSRSSVRYKVTADLDERIRVEKMASDMQISLLEFSEAVLSVARKPIVHEQPSGHWSFGCNLYGKYIAEIEYQMNKPKQNKINQKIIEQIEKIKGVKTVKLSECKLIVTFEPEPSLSIDELIEGENYTYRDGKFYLPG